MARWSYGLRRVTPPDGEPVDVQSAIDQLRLPDYPSDVMRLQDMLVAAREHVEEFTGRALIAQTWRATFDGFPATAWIELPRPPLIAVTKFTIYGDSGVGVDQSLVPYVQDTSGLFGRFALPVGVSWPVVGMRAVAGAAIEFTAGYGTSGLHVPMVLQHAIVQLAAHWYDAGRTVVTVGAEAHEVPMTVRTLLNTGDFCVRRRFA